jgi:hypothetical protein
VSTAWHAPLPTTLSRLEAVGKGVQTPCLNSAARRLYPPYIFN